MKCTNMESLEDLLLNDNDIIIMIKKEFTDESWQSLESLSRNKTRR